MARNLRRIRVARGVSQEALALQAGVDRTYVSRIERGLENPSVGVLEDLAETLKVELAEFFAKPKAGEAAPRPLPSGRRRGSRRPRH